MNNFCSELIKSAVGIDDTLDYYDMRIVKVIAYPQTWGSTALGFGGMGGCVMTTAMTVAVHARGKDFDKYSVYFGGRLAYTIKAEDFTEKLYVEIFENGNAPSINDLRKFKI